MNNLERRVAEMEESSNKRLINSNTVICGTHEQADEHRQVHQGEFRYIITGVTRSSDLPRAWLRVEN
jgi:hypothetical protein